MRFFFWVKNLRTGETRRCLSDTFRNACRLAGWLGGDVVLLGSLKIPEAENLRGQGSRKLPCCYLSEQGGTRLRVTKKVTK